MREQEDRGKDSAADRECPFAVLSFYLVGNYLVLERAAFFFIR